MISAFDECAGDYDSYRPSYPNELYAYLAERFQLSSGSVVVDIGAGTGRASQLFAEKGCRVIAIEPGAAMRSLGKRLEARFSGRIRFVDGTAEQTGVGTRLADLITFAQSFHWCDPARALPEAARVLKPGGGLALFWNERNWQHTAIGQDLEALILCANPSYQSHPHFQPDVPWSDVIAASGLFCDVVRKNFHHSVEMNADMLCGLSRSYSYIHNVLDTAGLEVFERELRALVEKHYGSQPFPFAYRVEVYAATKQ